MRIDNIIKEVADELGINVEDAEVAYNACYSFIHTKISELPFKEDLSEEEFSKLRPNFNMPSLGKFNITYDKYVKVRTAYKEFLKLKEENVQNKKD